MGLRVLTVSFVLGIGGWCAYEAYHYAHHAQAFAVQRIEVRGQNQQSVSSVNGASGIVSGMNIFDVRSQEVLQGIRGLPWVRSASFQRHLPSTVEIHIEEHVAAALVQVARSHSPGFSTGEIQDEPAGTLRGDASETWLASKQGVLFKPWKYRDPHDFPVVTGLVRDMEGRVPEELPGSVLTLMHNHASWSLHGKEPLQEIHVDTMGGGLVVYLGDPTVELHLGQPPYGRALRRVARVLTELKRRRSRPLYIHANNPNRPARLIVRLK